MQVKLRESLELTNHGVWNSSLRRLECGVMDAIGQMHDDREWVHSVETKQTHGSEGFYHVEKRIMVFLCLIESCLSYF
jgi:hypothetical protein